VGWEVYGWDNETTNKKVRSMATDHSSTASEIILLETELK
jgi:hypothetical protein